MTLVRMLAVVAVFAVAVAPAFAQQPQPAPESKTQTPDEKKEDKPKTLWEEHVLFAYIEGSYVWNLGHTGRDDVNELRFYDFDAGFTFNIAEFSIKKDPSERYPFGYGLVLTAGLDSQKNHAIGIFRDKDDNFPFRNTPKFDLQEAYLSGRIPVGNGIVVKGGKFVTLLGYEVIEAPNNLNFSRSFLFSLAIPLTHVGALVSYPVFDWLTLTAGPVVGWDIADDNNGAMSWTGQVAVTPMKDLITNLNWISGKEYSYDTVGHLRNGGVRTVLDFVTTYTGFKNLTLGANVTYGWEEEEAFLKSISTRSDFDARWWGYAGYVAYDWTDKLRTALRGEFFSDPMGARTGAGQKVDLWEVTATAQYKIWKGLMGRVEFRHDQADTKVFKVRTPGLVPTSKSQDTITFVLDYLFF
jgi:Putative beta-barrel porin-2, OmpL-like. bbp2